MEQEIKVRTYKEFHDRVDAKDFKISQMIVNSILQNLDSPKPKIHILSVNCTDEDTTYDLSLEKSYFADTLQENLQFFIENEQFEKCSEITKVIEQLKK